MILSSGDELQSNLLFAGFINVVASSSDEVTADKPKYEVGSSAKLSFGKKEDKAKVAAVWKIDNDDDEIIDADELLDEEDLAKPDPASLKGKIHAFFVLLQ